MLLKDKVCLITGTNRGIGSCIIEKFAKEGAIVYANAREDGCLDDRCKELEQKYNTKVYPIYFDVTDDNTVKEAFISIKKEYKKLDVLVNNAGIMESALLGMISKESMERMFNTNVFATINLMQMATKLMRVNKSGSIINFSSITGTQGSAGQVVYSASKGAVISLTKAAAKELASVGIRVNAVAPGMIDTKLLDDIGKEKVEKNVSKIMMGRLGNPYEVADACVFLASDMSSYITGQILGIDGETVI